MSAVHYVAHDYACSILDLSEVQGSIICEDCEEVAGGRECPVDYECLNRNCPRHALAEELIDDIERLLNVWKIY